MYLLIAKNLSLKIGFPIMFDQLVRMSVSASSTVDKNAMGLDKTVSSQISVSPRTYQLTLYSGVSLALGAYISNNKFANEGRAFLIKELLEFARSEGMIVTGESLPLECVVTNYSYIEDEKEGVEVNLSLQELMISTPSNALKGKYQVGSLVRLTEAASKLLFAAKKGLGGGVL